jgi:hypothetical protein
MLTRRARLAAGVLPLILGACYTYRPVGVTPVPNTRLALVLNDQGRVGAASQVGPQVAKLEGNLLAATDTGYVVSVAAVQAIYGARTRWTGETVSVRRDYVAFASERRFSRGRTALFIGSAVSAVVALVMTTHIFGIGGDGPPGGPGGGTGEQ